MIGRPELLAGLALALVFLPAPAARAGDDAPSIRDNVAERLQEVIFERLEASAATRGFALCFAPGTPPEYVAQIGRRTERMPIGLALGSDFDKYQGPPNFRWSSTATQGGGLGQGDPTVLTWSYVPDGTSIFGYAGEGTSPSNLHAWLGGIYGNFTAWHALFVQVFDRWAELTGITYVYEPNDDGSAWTSNSIAVGQLGVRGDVRIAAHTIDGNSGVLAYNFFPNFGDMILDSADSFYNNTSGGSLGLRNVLAHEHGHGLGIEHVCPVHQTKLMEPFVSFAFDGPQPDDILGAQRSYGGPPEDNDSAAMASALASSTIQVDNVSIDSAGDVDYYSFPAAAGETLTVTLTPIGTTYLEGPQNENGSCSAGTSFDALREIDLTLELLDQDGTTVLAFANDGLAGEAEILAGVQLAAAGTYFLRVTGNGIDRAQLYQLLLSGDGGGAVSAIFTDGFESGNTSLWSSTVP